MANEKPKEEKKVKKGGAFGFIFFMILFGGAVPFIFPTMVLCLLGMIPTFVALFTDMDRDKSSSTAVGAMNAAGITPFIIDLWSKGQTPTNLFHILHEPTTWLVMFGAAGVGQLIVFAVPQAVASLTFARDEARLITLKKNLESLQESWGTEVGTTKPIDKIGGG